MYLDEFCLNMLFRQYLEVLVHDLHRQGALSVFAEKTQGASVQLHLAWPVLSVEVADHSLLAFHFGKELLL